MNETHKGRSNRLPHLPPPPPPHHLPLLNLHPLHAPLQSLHPPLHHRPRPHPNLVLPTAPRERAGRTTCPLQRGNQTVPQRRLWREGTEWGGRVQSHGGAFVGGDAEIGEDKADGGGVVGVVCGGV